MRVERQITINAEPEVVWGLISDPSNYLDFMEGVTRWQAESEHRRGLGARYAIRMKVGSAEVGGLIEVVEFDAPYDLAWTGVTGVDQRGRWRLRPLPDERTRVALRLHFHAGGGLFGLIADRFAAPIVGSNLKRSLERLDALVAKSLDQPIKDPSTAKAARVE